MGIGEWGLGCWGVGDGVSWCCVSRVGGLGPNPNTPLPNPQSPTPNPQKNTYFS